MLGRARESPESHAIAMRRFHVELVLRSLDLPGVGAPAKSTASRDISALRCG
jgi:hypothetical protein